MLLHFGAVDWEAEVEVNGRVLATHRGGYDPFSVDVSDALQAGANELVLRVSDSTDTGLNAYGKQAIVPPGPWYTSSSGIWQSVWLEPVPQNSIDRLTLTPDLDAGALRLSVSTRGAATDFTFEAVARAGNKIVGRITDAN